MGLKPDAVVISFVSGQLMRLVAKALPPSPLARSADAIQFQQSLQFTGQRETLGGLITTVGRERRGRGGRALPPSRPSAKQAQRRKI